MPKKNSYSLFSSDGDKQDDTLDAICPKLTYKQRLYGFGICAGGGRYIFNLKRLDHLILESNRLHV